MNYWEGKKVRLRGLEPEDYEFFYNWNLETETQKHLDHIWFPTSKAHVKQWAEKQSVQKGENDQFSFVIETVGGKTVGTIGANNVSQRSGTFRYGIGIIQEARQKGYASDAIKIFLSYYFHELRYHKVNASVFAFNEGSIALHQKLGFKQEGRLREMVYTDGQHWDEIIFGMTRGEFEAV